MERITATPGFLRNIGISDPAIKKFKRYLNSLEQVFGKLGESRRIPILDKMRGSDDSFRQYDIEIQRALGDQFLYLQYLSGSWDDFILSVVSSAQKRHMVPERLKTRDQQNPRVSFAPRSDYVNYYNR